MKEYQITVARKEKRRNGRNVFAEDVWDALEKAKQRYPQISWRWDYISVKELEKEEGRKK